MKEYTVFHVGGKEDGQILKTFSTECEAIRFAEKYWTEHEHEFDPVCGGVGIADNDNNPVEW